jgi:hypothetical protein
MISSSEYSYACSSGDCSQRERSSIWVSDVGIDDGDGDGDRGGDGGDDDADDDDEANDSK